MEPTAVALRWHTRSVERRFDDEVAQWSADPDEDGLRLSVGAALSHASEDDHDDERPVGAPSIALRVVLQLDRDDLSIKLDCATRFTFAENMDMTPEEAADFATTAGLAYAFGFVRGAMCDLPRSVGLAGVMLPALYPEEMISDIREWVLRSE